MILSFGDLGFVVAVPVDCATFDAMVVLSEPKFCVRYLRFIFNTLALPLHDPMFDHHFTQIHLYLGCIPIPAHLGRMPILVCPQLGKDACLLEKYIGGDVILVENVKPSIDMK